MILRRGVSSLCSFPLFVRFGIIMCKSNKRSLLYSSQSRSASTSTSVTNRTQFLNSIQSAKPVDAFGGIYREMLRTKPLPPLREFALLFGSAVEMRYYFPVISFIRDLHSSVLAERDVNIMNILINCFCSLRFTNLGLSTMGSMLKTGLERDAITFTTLINGLCGEGKVDQAIELLQNMEEMEYESQGDIYGAMLSGFHEAPFKDRLVPKALKMCLEMSNKGIEPTLATYNCLLEGLCNSGRWNEASILLIYMLRTRIMPDWETFNMVAHALSQQGMGMVSGVKIIMSLMIRSGIQPNVITFTLLIYGYCSQNQINEAIKVLDLMVERGCLPDIVTYNSLMYGFCRTNNILCAVDLIGEMLHSKLLPDLVTWNTFIHGCFRAGDPEAAFRMYVSMPEYDENSNLHTENIIFDGLLKYGYDRRAKFFFGFFEPTGFKLNIVSYNIMLHDMCRPMNVREVNDAREFFSRMVAKGLKIDVYSYAIMIQGLCNAGLLDDAEELLINMDQNGCLPNAWVRGLLNKRQRLFCRRHRRRHRH